jgi:DNA-binding CsgD family transcriptional regulator
VCGWSRTTGAKRTGSNEREREREHRGKEDGDGQAVELERRQTLATKTSSNREGRGRRARRDRGSFQVSDRDRELLGLIAEQYAVTLDQLALLIGRTHRTARGLRDRWCNAGWTESAKLAVDLPPFVWLTSRGTRVAQSPFRPWDANHGLASHIEAVTNVRLLLERELRLGSWECERLIAQDFHSRSEIRPHLPVAVLDCPQKVAIEVELSLKSRARLDAIIRDLGETYEHVWYFAAPRLVPTLEEVASLARWQNVRVHRYPAQAIEVAASAQIV